MERRRLAQWSFALLLALACGCGQSGRHSVDSATNQETDSPQSQTASPQSETVAAQGKTPAAEAADESAAGQQSGSTPPPIERWVEVQDFDVKIAQFKTVFWEPRDTSSLRKLIRETSLVEGKRVLEIGTGTGLVSLCCLQAGAARVVATDVNPSAVANARYNASSLGLDRRFEPRLVPLEQPSAFRVVGPDERFDLIISNPPWEDATPESIDKYALYDPSFALLHSLLADLRKHLEPGGKALLAYGCVDAIRMLLRLADRYDLKVRVLDDRDLHKLEPVFLPGMLLEVTPREKEAKSSPTVSD